MECKECNLCCKLFQIDATGSPVWKLCKRWDKDSRCKIYSKRPGQCSGFMCLYVLAEGAPLKSRPDKCGVVFEKISKHIILGTKENNRPIKKVVKDMIKEFNQKGYSVIINSKDATTEIYKTKEMTKTKLIKELKEKHGTVIVSD